MILWHNSVKTLSRFKLSDVYHISIICIFVSHPLSRFFWREIIVCMGAEGKPEKS